MEKEKKFVTVYVKKAHRDLIDELYLHYMIKGDKKKICEIIEIALEMLKKNLEKKQS